MKCESIPAHAFTLNFIDALVGIITVIITVENTLKLWIGLMDIRG